MTPDSGVPPKHVLIAGSYTLSRNLFTGFFLSFENFPFMKNEMITGARVTTRMASTIMINVLV